MEINILLFTAQFDEYIERATSCHIGTENRTEKREKENARAHYGIMSV